MKTKIKDKKICIVGLGYVGLTLAAILLKRGFHVYGIEKNKNILNSLKGKKAHFYEPGINTILKKKIETNQFIFSHNIKKIYRSDIYIITVGTPLGKNGRSRTDIIRNATREVLKYLKNNDLVILRSTVKIGTTRNLVSKILNKKKCNYFLSYCPERTQEGKALKELLVLPQIIGSIDKKSEKISSQFFKQISNETKIVSNLEAAELTKLISNTYRDVSFGFANEIAIMCKKLNLNSKEIIDSGNYKYIRTNIPMPGPVAGPCLSKDSHILKESFEKYKNYFPKISHSARKTNEKMPAFILDNLKNDFPVIFNKKKRLTFGILGLAFKGNPPTNDTRESISLKFINLLKSRYKKCTINTFDKMIKKSDVNFFEINIFNTLKSVFLKADAIFILNNHKYFKKINLKQLSKHMKFGGCIFDCWAVANMNKYVTLNNNVTYKSLRSWNKI